MQLAAQLTYPPQQSQGPAMEPTPTSSGLPLRFSGFGTLRDALDYAASGQSGMNFYSGRLELSHVLSYRDLRDSAQSLARKMLGAGLKPGERVALIADTDADFVRTFFACQYAGLIPAPLPMPQAFGGREGYVALVRRMIVGARASAAFSPAWLDAWLQEAVAGIDLKLSGSFHQVTELPEADTDLPPAHPDMLSYLQFSSGSTRAPTGVAVTHRALLANATAMIHHGLDVRAGDRTVSWLPFYHDMGLVGFLLTPLISQLSVDYLATRDFARRPLGWLSLMNNNGGTIAFSPSFGYDLCARRATTQSVQLDLSTWRVAGIGGDMIRANILDNFSDTFQSTGFRRTAFVPSYGMAEATLAVCFSPLETGVRTDTVDMQDLEHNGLATPATADTRRSRVFVNCGPVVPGHELEVRDEDGTVRGQRQVGRVFVRGPSLMREYDGQPEETRRVMSPDGWLDTGDLGYLIGDELVVTGRIKDMMIVNGRNIWPQDVEWATEHVDGVRQGDAAAFSLDQGGDSEEIVVLVQCRLNDQAQREALRGAITTQLRKAHGLDVRIVLVPNNSLPMTSSGKLSRSAARRAFVEGQLGNDDLPGMEK